MALPGAVGRLTFARLFSQLALAKAEPLGQRYVAGTDIVTATALDAAAQTEIAGILPLPGVYR